MAIKHVRGEFFDADHGADHAAFGFSGSLTPLPSNASGMAQKPDFPPTRGTKDRPEPMDEYATGGPIHMHPHGHHVARVEHRYDGAVVHHHSHGGFTFHHPDGRIMHHHGDGSPVHAAHGGMMRHDGESEYAHGGHAMDREMRGDEAQDKAMIKKAVMQHENHEHHGEHTDLHLRRGGIAMTARLPRGMRPAAERSHSPVNSAPRNPTVSRSTPNAMPGGVMAYGVQPGDEPDMGASPPPGMRHGGRTKRK